LNIKSERAVALVRELAARTGSTQTSAVEDAVARRLEELDRDQCTTTSARRRAADDVLRQLNRLLTDDDKRAILHSAADLYDDDGLPR
jgi:hypothetical protein